MAGSTGMKVDSGTGQKLSWRGGDICTVCCSCPGNLESAARTLMPRLWMTACCCCGGGWGRVLVRLAMPLSWVRLRCDASKPTGMESPLVWWSAAAVSCGSCGGGAPWPGWPLESARVVTARVESGQVLGQE